MTGNRKRTITRHVDYITSVNPGIAEYSLVAAVFSLHGFSCVHQAQKSIINLVQDTLELVFVRHVGYVLVNEDFQLLHSCRDAYSIVVDVDTHNDGWRLHKTHVRIDLEVLHSLTRVANHLDESPYLKDGDILVLADNLHGGVPFRTQVFRRSGKIVRDIDKHCAIFLFSHLRGCNVLCSLQYKMRSYLSYGGFKKEIKTHLVFDCLSKFTSGQGFTQLINESYLHLYHTCVKKSIEYIKTASNETISK